MALLVWLPLRGDLNNYGLNGDVNVTNSGATISNNGKIGKCYSVTSPQYLEINNLPFSNLTDCSISFWLKVDSFGSSGWLPVAGLTSSQYILATKNGTGNFYHGNVGNNSKVYKDGILTLVPGTIGEWHHYVMTGLNLSTWTKLYINYYPSYVATWHFNGLINDFRIYDHCLSPKEVHDLALGLVLHYKLDEIIGKNLVNNCKDITTGWGRYASATVTYEDGRVKAVAASSGLPRIYNSTILPYESTREYYTIYIDYEGDSIGIMGKSSNSITSLNESGSLSCGEFTRIKQIELGNNRKIAVYKWFRLAMTDTIKASWWMISFPINTTLYINAIKVEKGLNENIIWSPYNISYSTIHDLSGYQNNGSIIGNLTILSDSARYSSSTFFDGNTSGILIQNFNLSNIINTALTYSFWIKPNGENGARSVYFGSYSNTSFSIEKTTTNKLRLWWNGSPDLTSTLTIVDDQWLHIAITKSGNTEIKAYLNGTLIQTFTQTFNNLTFPTTYRIGRDSRDGTTSYHGLMSDFRIYTTVLSDDDILDLYKVGASVDNLLNFYTYEIEENGNLQILSKTNMSLTGYTSYYSPYLSISPGVYDYDITYEATGSNNWNLIGFERWDENKTSTSNAGCRYVLSQRAEKSKTRIFGTVNLTNDLNSNPVAFTRLRVLNDWDNKNTSNSLTIYSISLMKSGTHKPLLILHTGEAICNEFQELDNTSIRSNGITETNNIYEI